jgi:site-specific DNA-methyltransferase (adenine-specific)
MARKPLIGTVAENVLEHGTGAINVDASRVGNEYRYNPPVGDLTSIGSSRTLAKGEGRNVFGRWPANLIHDGSDEVVGLFPETRASNARLPTGKHVYGHPDGRTSAAMRTSSTIDTMLRGHNDAGGSAARFFYCPKASKAEREAGLEEMEEKPAGSLKMRTDAHAIKNGMNTEPQRNHHPTVKPTDLMRYLCRLVTPPNGTILDPFTGSGSTGVAALREGFKFIGIELNPEYAKIAQNRIENELNKAPLFTNA